MSRILIGGLGNVLLEDDGIGPFVVRTLAARYRFGNEVEVEDLGTPGLDLTEYFLERERIILVDSVQSEQAPGSIQLYRKAEILQAACGPRTGPHAPSLTETLLSMEILGRAPAEVLLVGVAGKSYEIGCGLSAELREAVDAVIAAILRELDRIGLRYEPKNSAQDAEIWWTEPQLAPATSLTA
jgi:hydrogenase maturation protease